MQPLVIVGFVVIFIVVLVVGYISALKRREAMAAVAAKLGLHFMPHKDRGMARRFYNGNVRDYRNKCEAFPSNIIAGAFGFQPQDYFRVSPSVREVPDTDFG